ncbi:hypothetical protein HDU97_001695 [Phlyctochytrium planicorne]|nr:hypothetical protein HDU97_001695 [Phlyctochytrium planicorne]
MNSDPIYTSSNIIANAMRSICIGYAFSVIITCGVMMNFINKKGAILPIVSATFLLGFNICLEMRILTHRDKVLQIIAYVLFVIRAASLVVLLFYYYDVTSATGLCATGFPFNALLAEKLILLFYNLGNIAILLYIFRRDAADNKNFKSGGIIKVFLLQDGSTFIMAIVLDTIYILIVSFITTTWIFSMAAGLANGFNCLILHVKYCTSLKGRVGGQLGLQAPSPAGSALKAKSDGKSSTMKTKNNTSTPSGLNQADSFQMAPSAPKTEVGNSVA